MENKQNDGSMTKTGKLSVDDIFKLTPEQNLREAAIAYLYTAIRLYIKLEARVSIWSRGAFGDSANIVCSLSRAIEHLLKLRLIKMDPLLLYPLPKKIEEYCCRKNILIKKKGSEEKLIQERELSAHTIPFLEALSRVELTQTDTEFNFSCFKKIYALRNSLEHHWDRNEQLLQSVVGMISKTVMPCLKEYIETILHENVDDFINKKLMNEVERLDRAMQAGHSLDLQKRFEDHKSLYNREPASCVKKYSFPDKYKNFEEEETEAECPICNSKFTALWDWEADYDIEGHEYTISGSFPDVKCLFCSCCNFYVDGSDIWTYLPEDFKVEVEHDNY